MIIVNGRNLYPHEVEAALGGVEGLKAGRIVAVGHADARSGGQALIILAERPGDAAASDASIRTHVADRHYSVFEVRP